jgi:methylthioribose-1-phosphate isomerase
MRIRGAPAIGVAGAYAVALAALEVSESPHDDFIAELDAAAKDIEYARPTGANLAWAVRRMMAVARNGGRPHSVVDDLIAEAVRIQDEDEKANLAIGRFGAELIRQGSSVLTHCNAGALATGGYGTALGVIKTAWAGGKISQVYATETRPLFQGSRLTAWELQRESISATVLPDSAAGQLMRRGGVQAVIVGADRIAANGDVANKIGTYSLAVLAKENRLPFYVAAPTSTIDMSLPSGDSIPIEERTPEEVTHAGATRVVPEETDVLNPAFDVTPNEYVTAIITEVGVARPPYGREMAEAVEASGG